MSSSTFQYKTGTLPKSNLWVEYNEWWNTLRLGLEGFFCELEDHQALRLNQKMKQWLAGTPEYRPADGLLWWSRDDLDWVLAISDGADYEIGDFMDFELRGGGYKHSDVRIIRLMRPDVEELVEYLKPTMALFMMQRMEF